MVSGKMNYIFLDEIQYVAHYEKAVDSLFVQKNADVYITGSNAYFMSGELATLLSGRNVELKMLPLSFAEYVSAFPDAKSKEDLYRDYIYNSSFPYTVGLRSRKQIHTYLDGLYNNVVFLELLRRGYQVYIGKAGSRRRTRQPDQCPDCGKYAVREATEAERQEYEKRLKEPGEV